MTPQSEPKMHNSGHSFSRRPRESSRTRAACFIDFRSVKAEADASAVMKLRGMIQDDHDADLVALVVVVETSDLGHSALPELVAAGWDLRAAAPDSADVAMAVEAMDTLASRPDIGLVALAGSGGALAPLAAHIRRTGRRMVVVGEGLAAGRKSMTTWAAISGQPGARAAAEAPAGPTEPFADCEVITDTLTLEALQILVESYGDKPEVWVSPFLHKLRAEMPHLEEDERKDILAELRETGSIVVEKRRGEPHDYSVLFINWEHPNVIEYKKAEEEA